MFGQNQNFVFRSPFSFGSQSGLFSSRYCLFPLFQRTTNTERISTKHRDYSCVVCWLCALTKKFWDQCCFASRTPWAREFLITNIWQWICSVHLITVRLYTCWATQGNDLLILCYFFLVFSHVREALHLKLFLPAFSQLFVLRPWWSTGPPSLTRTCLSSTHVFSRSTQMSAILKMIFFLSFFTLFVFVHWSDTNFTRILPDLTPTP